MGTSIVGPQIKRTVFTLFSPVPSEGHWLKQDIGKISTKWSKLQAEKERPLYGDRSMVGN